MRTLETDRAEIARIAASLDIPHLRACWHVYERGGLPAHSLPGPGHTDPPPPRHDPTDRRLQNDRAAIIDHLHRARQHLRQAEAIARYWTAISTAVEANTSDADGWCTSCARAGIFEPRGSARDVGQTSTLCRWCHGFQREHGRIPPVELLRHHADGRRITTRLIEQTLSRPARRR